MIYDYERWDTRIYEYSSLEHLPSVVSDGVYKINHDNACIHFLIDGIEKIDPYSPTILVSFNSALEQRSVKTPPFFCGLNLSKKMNLPILAFSDPTVDQSESVGLAWYLGNNKIKNLVEEIAKIINRVSELLSSKVIIFGGSNGGFAALNVLRHLSIDASAVVWNPQTSVSAYIPNSVSSYLKESFPSDYQNFLGNKNCELDARDYYEILDKLGLHHHLFKYDRNNKNPIIYLQNKSDWHYKKHAIPFISQFNCNTIEDGIIHSPEDDIILFLGDWGFGHVVPPLTLIYFLIEKLTKGLGINDIRFEDLRRYDNPPAKNNESSDFEVRTAIEAGNVLVSVELKKKDPTLKFAFYLYDEKLKIDQIWYKEEPFAVFACDNLKRNLSVKVFIKDKKGFCLTKKVKVVD